MQHDNIPGIHAETSSAVLVINGPEFLEEMCIPWDPATETDQRLRELSRSGVRVTAIAISGTDLMKQDDLDLATGGIRALLAKRGFSQDEVRIIHAGGQKPPASQAA